MVEPDTLKLVNPRQQKRAATRVKTDLDELVERVARVNPEDGRIEPLAGLWFNRLSNPREIHSVARPCFCIIAQGSKEVFLGDERYQYDPAHYLLFTAELPVVSQALEASRERPYLSLRLDLDAKLVGSVLAETRYPPASKQAEVRAMDVSVLTQDLLGAMLRLVRLAEHPRDAAFLAPLIKREIVYRLLIGEQGGRLRHIAVAEGNEHRIVKAIERLRRDFDRPIQMESLAQDLGMSVSSFYHHFKVVTAMSPLQFQKRLRLQEARRLMLGGDFDAASAAFRVGYEDASHFSREYKRLFGQPPKRDVERLKDVVTERTEREVTLAT